MSGLTVQERIITFLETLPIRELGDRDVWPWEATQDGIAKALGIKRAHASIELHRLFDCGKVVRFVCHVKDGKQRRLVYRPGDGLSPAYVQAEVVGLSAIRVRCPGCSRRVYAVLPTNSPRNEP